MTLFVQGYLAREKQHPPMTLHLAYAKSPMVVVGGDAFSCERGTPVVQIRLN